MPHYRTGHGHTLERVNGGGGIEFAGREWRGKTAHAVEQEMETLRDENLMSHAPDATYLASRLEGLKRNLEAQGERRPSYVEYEQDLVLDGTVTQADHPEHPDDLSTAPSLPLQSTSAASLSTSLADSSVSNLSASSDWIGSTKMDVDPLSIPSVEPAAKAAALDARIELRPLRRADLEQVRELHCLHGDSDRVSIRLPRPCCRDANASAGSSDRSCRLSVGSGAVTRVW